MDPSDSFQQSADLPDFWVYPLRAGDTLSSNDWIEWRFHEFLSSSMLAHSVYDGEIGRAALATAVILWSECYRQDPAGTLPDDDIELAQLARYGTDVDAWRAVRARVMYGWVPVQIDGSRSNRGRLGHEFIASIAKRSFDRKSGRLAARDAAKLAGVRFKVRKKLTDMKRQRLADQDPLVDALARYLTNAGLQVNIDNVTAALETVAGIPRVVPFSGAADG